MAALDMLDQFKNRESGIKWKSLSEVVGVVGSFAVLVIFEK